MRLTDLDILIVPGWTNSGPEHWQSRWQDRMSTARRVQLGNWEHPVRAEWVEALVAAITQTRKPSLLVAHSLGTLAVAHAAPRLPPGKVAGAFLVAVPDLEQEPRPPEIDPAFYPYPCGHCRFRAFWCTPTAIPTAPYPAPWPSRPPGGPRRRTRAMPDTSMPPQATAPGLRA